MKSQYRRKLLQWIVYFNDEYHNGQVYKTTFEKNNKLYVGCSTRNLQERLNHRDMWPQNQVQYINTRVTTQWSHQ